LRSKVLKAPFTLKDEPVSPQIIQENIRKQEDVTKAFSKAEVAFEQAKKLIWKQLKK
jgi:hypothetical protein